MNGTVGKIFHFIRSRAGTTAVFAMGLGLAGAQSALAMTTLKQVQVSNSAQVDLLFDGKVNKSQIQTEFFNDIIQLSMVDVTVYPAKISSVNGGLLTKVFAYQYAPRLVRCRLTVNGKAESYKDRLVINTNGRLLTVRIADGRSDRADTLGVQSSAPVRAEVSAATNEKAPPKAVEKEAPKEPIKAVMDVEEKALLDRVMSAPVQHPSNGKVRPVVKDKEEGKESPKQKGAALKMGGARPLPSLTGVLMKLGFVMGIFGLFALVLKKFMGAKGNARPSGKFGGVSEKEMATALGTRGIKGALGGVGRFFQGSFGKLGQKEKLIEVLSNHQLGPKQSIAVVRVCGKKMVIGIANDSITLISQLAGTGGIEAGDEDFDLDASLGDAPLGLPRGAGATVAGPALFAELLKKEQTRPSVGASPAGPAVSAYSRSAPQAQRPATPSYQQPVNPAADVSVRARIRSRLEGLKPL